MSGGSAPRLKPGDKAGRYELLLQVAQGGMGAVWVARLKLDNGFEKLFAGSSIFDEVLANGTTVRIAAGFFGSLTGAAASATHAVWFGPDVQACTRNDCATTTQSVGPEPTGFTSNSAVSMTGNRVVWASPGDGFRSMEVPAGTGIISGASAADNITDLGVDGTNVYFIASSRRKLGVQSLIANSKPTDLADAIGAVALTIDATTVYFAGSGGIHAVDRMTGASTARVMTAARGVAVSGQSLYWTDAATGRVLKGPK